MNAIISAITNHVKAVIGVIIALLAFLECLTTGMVTSTIGLLGVQSGITGAAAVAPANMLSVVTGSLTSVVDVVTKLGGMGLEQFGQFIGWLMDFIVKTILFMADKVMACIDLIFRLLNTIYQTIFQFFSQSINAIIDRVVYFLARKPWGSFGETPLGMRCQEKLRIYCYIRYQRWRIRYTRMVKNAKKFNSDHNYSRIKEMTGQYSDYGNLEKL